MATAQASSDENRWLVWMVVDAMVVMLFLFALSFMAAGSLPSRVGVATIAVSLVLGVLVIPGWAVFGLAGGDGHEPRTWPVVGPQEG